MGGKLTIDFPHSLEEATRIAERVIAVIEDALVRWSFAGSIRREKESFKDIDLVVIPRDLDWVIGLLRNRFEVISGGTKKMSLQLDGNQVDIYFATTQDWGAQLLRWTGSKVFNIKCSIRAKKRGMKLNQYGLWRGLNRVAGADEEQILNEIGKGWVDPKDRE